MEDSDGSDVEFSVLSETFQLLGAYSEAENEQEKVQKIRDHIRLIEKEDAEECPEFYQGKWLKFLALAITVILSLSEYRVIFDNRQYGNNKEICTFI